MDGARAVVDLVQSTTMGCSCELFVRPIQPVIRLESAFPALRSHASPRLFERCSRCCCTRSVDEMRVFECSLSGFMADMTGLASVAGREARRWPWIDRVPLGCLAS